MEQVLEVFQIKDCYKLPKHRTTFRYFTGKKYLLQSLCFFWYKLKSNNVELLFLCFATGVILSRIISFCLSFLNMRMWNHETVIHWFGLSFLLLCSVGKANKLRTQHVLCWDEVMTSDNFFSLKDRIQHILNGQHLLMLNFFSTSLE